MQVHVEQVRLHVFPLPALALFAPLEFDLLHAGDQLARHVPVDALLLEHLVIQHAPLFQEYHDPQAVEDAAGEEHGEDGHIVDEQHHREDHEGKGGEQHRDGLVGEEVLNAAVVFDALQQVARELGVEELHGQFHQFDKEVGDEGDVDAGADMQQYLAADEVDCGAAEQQHHLGDEHQPDKADVFPGDASVHDGLGKEREDELQQAADKQAED